MSNNNTYINHETFKEHFYPYANGIYLDDLLLYDFNKTLPLHKRSFKYLVYTVRTIFPILISQTKVSICIFKIDICILRELSEFY